MTMESNDVRKALDDAAGALLRIKDLLPDQPNGDETTVGVLQEIGGLLIALQKGYSLRPRTDNKLPRCPRCGRAFDGD